MLAGALPQGPQLERQRAGGGRLRVHEEVHLRLPGGHGDGAAVHGPDVEDFARLQVKLDEDDYGLISVIYG